MNILVGISGGIAAYKSPELVRRLRERGLRVRVVMTQSATAFIGELTLQAVSGNPVFTKLVDPEAEAAMGHIELARWADAIVIAPATANCIAQLAHGKANDLLSTLVLASNASLFIAPAMNQQMWHSAATQANIQSLVDRGASIIGPDSGDQACGDVGPGRMTEPDLIATEVAQAMNHHSGALANKTVLITAGPTQEAIDPVRYISNHSSGKMGYALAEMAALGGAKVILVSGPVALETPEGVDRINVISATDMQEVVMQHVKDSAVFIGCAAVADYRVQEPAKQKIKKNDDQLVLTMVKNPDIITQVANHPAKPFCVGFAAETEQPEVHGRKKLKRKGLDMICINDVSDSSIGFNSDDNQLMVYVANSENCHTIDKSSKRDVARQLMRLIEQQL